MGHGRGPREALLTSALVLGAGGTVGMAYHAGVLRALEEVGGFRPDDADLVVGTSAGSMIGALVRSGLSTRELWDASLGVHETIGLEPPDERPWVSAVETPADIVRRVFGSLYVLQRSLIRIPLPPVPAALRRLFPGGFYTIADAESATSELIPTAWPTKPLWLVTVDVRTGRRVVLGRRNPPRTDLRTAVMASCAIPAFFQPIRVNRRTLVDGGVHSTTNLDLTTKVSPDVVVGVVPMGFDPAAPPRGLERAVRTFSNRKLVAEVAQARRAGASVLLLRPTRDDLHAMGGLDMLRREGNDHVTRVAFESASRQLSTPYAVDVLGRLRETVAS